MSHKTRTSPWDYQRRTGASSEKEMSIAEWAMVVYRWFERGILADAAERDQLIAEGPGK